MFEKEVASGAGLEVLEGAAPACWLIRVRLCNASQLGFWNPAAGFKSQLTSQAIPRNLVTSQGRGETHRMSEHPAVPDTQLVLVECGYYENYFLAPGGQQVYDGPTTGWLRTPQFSQWSDDGEFKGTDHPARCPPGLCPGSTRLGLSDVVQAVGAGAQCARHAGSMAARVLALPLLGWDPQLLWSPKSTAESPPPQQAGELHFIRGLTLQKSRMKSDLGHLSRPQLPLGWAVPALGTHSCAPLPSGLPLLVPNPSWPVLEAWELPPFPPTPKPPHGVGILGANARR